MTAPDGPSGVPDVRISDAERERVVDVLRHHCAEGRLTLDEFSDRVGGVYEARTSAEIERVLTDLPRPQAPVAAGKPVSRRRAAVRHVWSVFSTSHQHGRWRLDE